MPRLDGGDVKVSRALNVRRVVWIVAAAFGLVAAAVATAVFLIRREPEQRAEGIAPAPVDDPTSGTAEPATAKPAARRVQPRRMAGRATPPSPAPDAPTGAPAGEGGIAVFPPPGTKALKRGIVVPDDFQLPEGFLRHYQTTDDGRRLEAIVMLHPDYELVDENGARVPIPADRIVPPELAPPGLPLRMLDVPDQAGTAGATP